jgi:hypothetical protein
LPDTVQYYVESNGVRSKTYNLTAIELPGIKKLRVTYNYPKWAGLKPAVEEPGGDLRAIEGTEASVAIETDKPLKSAVLILDNGERIDMQKGEGNWLAANVPIKTDGMYHIATVDKSEDIRLSDDYFIEAQKEQPPKVKIARPARDFKVNPIEEVSVQVEAEDDFALQDVSLSYSVNGGPEKNVSLLKHKGAKTAEGETLLSLEDFKLVPGDVVALHARAKDARSETMTDIMFLEAQPFEREYQQSQQMGGGGGGGEQEDDNVSKRQKEIIAATFNQIRDRGKNKSAEAENAKFLADTQGKLRDQSRSLANRMKSRELAQRNAEFQSFAKDMEMAAQAMNEAVDKLKVKGWKDAIQPEQKALQYLLRAEATRRQIQVAFGRQGGGGGGGAGRDLESLFDLELDTEKNQYETGMQSASADRKQKEADEALQKLEQLARRQQELAQQQRDQRQSPQQRWQQEMLRREAEELKKKMEELARSQSGQGQGAQSNQLRQAIDRLQRATDDMRQAASSQAAQPQAGSAEARRAADRLQEARDSVRGMRQQESGQQMSDLTRRADKLAEDQRDFVNKLKQTYGDGAQTRPMPGQDGGKAEQLAKQKEQMLNDLNGLERDMQSAARNMQGTQRGASSKIREALGEMQQNELKLRMKYGAEWIRRGLGGYVGSRETPVTMGLESLRNQLHNAESAMTPSNDKGKQSGVEQALNQIEQTRQQLQRASGGQQQGQRGQKGQQPGQGQQGQQQGQQGQGQQGQGQQGQGQQGQGQQGQGQQAGQQPGQGQQGQQGQGGQRGQQGQGGQQGQNGQEAGGGNGGQGGRNGGQFSAGEMGVYRSGNGIPQQGQISQAAAEQAFRNSVRDLQQLRQGLQDNPELAKEVENTLREIQRWDPAKHPGNPALLELMRTQVLPNIEQLELQLRRKLEGKDGEVRSSAAEHIPQGYGDAVAEYFRRLSKTK